VSGMRIHEAAAPPRGPWPRPLVDNRVPLTCCPTPCWDMIGIHPVHDTGAAASLRSWEWAWAVRCVPVQPRLTEAQPTG
jgi:hypothetical protein